MSAIDFNMDIKREKNEKGDRVSDHHVREVLAVQNVLTTDDHAGDEVFESPGPNHRR